MPDSDFEEFASVLLMPGIVLTATLNRQKYLQSALEDFDRYATGRLASVSKSKQLPEYESSLQKRVYVLTRMDRESNQELARAKTVLALLPANRFRVDIDDDIWDAKLDLLQLLIARSLEWFKKAAEQLHAPPPPSRGAILWRNINMIRGMCKWTWKEWSHRTGLDRTTPHYWMRDATIPVDDNIKAVADAYAMELKCSITVDDLWSETLTETAILSRRTGAAATA